MKNSYWFCMMTAVSSVVHASEGERWIQECRDKLQRQWAQATPEQRARVENERAAAREMSRRIEAASEAVIYELVSRDDVDAIRCHISEEWLGAPLKVRHTGETLYACAQRCNALKILTMLKNEYPDRCGEESK